MSKYKFLKEYDNGAQVFQPGWVAVIADGDAAPLVSDGIAVKVADNCPTKKGNLEMYDGCRPLSEATVKARKAKKEAEAPADEPELSE